MIFGKFDERGVTGPRPEPRSEQPRSRPQAVAERAGE